VSAFIILEQQRPEMALCSICPDPGHCCRNFDSTLIYWDDAAPAEVKQYMEFIAGEPMPWIPLGPGSKVFMKNGRKFSHWRFDCPKLDSKGRCTIYADRPRACRSLVPGTVDVCVFTKISSTPLPDEISPFPAFK
jgi:Fe-S-cluster containining protein